MMAHIYGVCTEHTAHRNGYSDFVQHTGALISGQLHQDAKSHFRRKLLIALNSVTEPELANPLIYPRPSLCIIILGSKHWLGVEALTKSAGSSMLGMRKISHTLNHQKAFEVAACQKEAFPLAGNLSKPDIVDALNLTKPDMRSRVAGGAILTIPKALSAAGHYPVLDNAVMHGFLHGATFAHRVCKGVAIGFLESIKKGGISATPECVGQSAILHFGHSFGFLRCSNLSFRPQASSTQAEKLALGFSGFSCSTLASISSINSCGKRIPFKLDLLLTFFVAIGFSPRWCVSTIHKNGGDKTLDVLEHSELWCSNTLSTGKAQATHKIATPRSGETLPRRLTTTVNHSNEAAMQNHTTPLTGRNSLTPNKFTWRFLAVSRADRNAKPCRMSVEAHTEREARQVLAPHFILSLAARLPVQGMGEISIPSTIEQISTVQEVSYA